MNPILNSMLAATELDVGGMPLEQFFGTFVGMVIILFGIVLAVCALLMPLYVVAIHSRLKLMHKEMEKQTWYLHKIANRE